MNAIFDFFVALCKQVDPPAFLGLTLVLVH